MSKAILLTCLGLWIGGCARPSAPVAPQAQMTKDLPMICRLVGREQTLTISAGPSGAVYSVNDAAGKVMLSYGSRDELRLGYPFLSQQLETGIADRELPLMLGIKE